MTSDQPIASYSYNYAAVHEAAFDINPSEQRMRFALEDYANSLPEYTADKLSYKIVKIDYGSKPSKMPWTMQLKLIRSPDNLK